MKLDTEEDYEKLTELAEETIDFWAENGSRARALW